jgi:hypothetical protein
MMIEIQKSFMREMVYFTECFLCISSLVIGDMEK